MTTKTKARQEKNKLSEIDDGISKMFDIKKRLGKGAYGIVWKAMDKRTNETVAMKKIFDAFRDETDAQRTFREIVFLKAFHSHPNVVKLLNVFKATNNLDIYLIFEYMESDLHNIIKKATILKDVHKRYVMYQLINAVKYIHSGNVIHRDLKPSNVLIDSKCRCKLADFGLARSVSSRPAGDTAADSSDPLIEPILTDYVATRWYRAPEILVASKRYTKGIDMWSLGCILGEMIRGKPLFQGSSTVNQIEKIVSVLPDVTEHDINAVGAGFGSVLLNKQISFERKTSLDEMFAGAPEDGVSLVKSLLLLDPLARLTAKEALAHPYVEKFRNSMPEIELNVDVLPPFRDDVRLSVPEYRSKLYEIVNNNLYEKSEKRLHSTKCSSSRQKEPKHLSSYDKSEPFKKSYKSKQHNSNQHISNDDKFFSRGSPIRPEKHEIETQPSVSVPSIGSKPSRKSSTSSPPVKRKPSKSKFAVQQQQQPQAAERIGTLGTRNKSQTKASNEMQDSEYHPSHTLDKRNSVDGCLGNLRDGGSTNLVKQQSSPNCGQLRKLDGSRRQYRSSSSLQRSDQVIIPAGNTSKPQQKYSLTLPHQHQHQQSRERTSTVTHLPTHTHNQAQNRHPHKQLPLNGYTYAATEQEQSVAQTELQERYSHTSAQPTTKSNHVHSTKSDLLNNQKNIKNQESNNKEQTKNSKPICYEKRLKRLEEEIERYKLEVKSFCQESFNGVHNTSEEQEQPESQQQHSQQQHQQPMQQQQHQQLQLKQQQQVQYQLLQQHQQQQLQKQQQLQHQQLQKQHQQQQQQLQKQQQQQLQKQQQQQFHKQQQQQHQLQSRQQQQQTRVKYSTSNTNNTKSHLQQPSSLPSMSNFATSTPKQNPYFEVMNKVSREYVSRNMHDGGGDGDDIIFSRDMCKERKHQLQKNQLYSTHPQLQPPQQQQQYNSQNQQHLTMNGIRTAARPRSKYLTRLQMTDHVVKSSIPNYQ